MEKARVDEEVSSEEHKEGMVVKQAETATFNNAH